MMIGWRQIARSLRRASPPTNFDLEAACKRFSIPEPGPVRPAFSQLDELCTAYDLGAGSADQLKGYFGAHWRRYLVTLGCLPVKSGLRILDVGIFPPFVFQTLVKASLPDSTIFGVWEGAAYRFEITSLFPTHPPLNIELRSANIETDELPFDEAEFDVVLGLEILEHLAIDPLFFLQEVARVLKPDGLLVLSTPNIASHRSVAKILRNEAPYVFGIYVPTGGVYGRHNREYTVYEVDKLGKAAGFRTERLVTADVYENDVDPNIIQLLAERNDTLEFRGEAIFYVARRGDVIGTDVPHGLFFGNPNQLSGHISIDRYDAATGFGMFLVTNKSRVPWPAVGEHRLCVYVEWFDKDGRLVHGGLILPLTETILPKGVTRVPFSFGACDGEGGDTEGEARAEIMQEGVGHLRGAGRANLVRVPCTERAYLGMRQGAVLPRT
jgi:SAM-dependent methyltransferase